MEAQPQEAWIFFSEGRCNQGVAIIYGMHILHEIIEHPSYARSKYRILEKPVILFGSNM